MIVNNIQRNKFVELTLIINMNSMKKRETDLSDLSETNCENITAPATKCCFRHLEKQDKTNKNI